MENSSENLHHSQSYNSAKTREEEEVLRETFLKESPMDSLPSTHLGHYLAVSLISFKKSLCLLFSHFVSFYMTRINLLTSSNRLALCLSASPSTLKNLFLVVLHMKISLTQISLHPSIPRHRPPSFSRKGSFLIERLLFQPFPAVFSSDPFFIKSPGAMKPT